MRPEDYENLYGIEDTFWWFRGMRRIHARLVGPVADPARRLLDSGCGTGANIVHLRELGFDAFGIDYSPDAMPWLRHRGISTVAQATATALPFPSESFDVVTSLDVVCQLPVSEVPRAFAEAWRVLKPGGYCLVRVPAFQWLWSPTDEAVLTVHRFTRGELQSLAKAAGFEVLVASYANTFLFPVAVGWRLLKRAGIQGGTDVRPLPPGLGWLNPLFARILGLEATWLGRGRSFPFGLSVIVWARKPL